MNKIKIGIFDDHPISAKGLSDSISDENREVVFCCSDKVKLNELLSKIEIDILISDIVAPDVSGLEIFEEISKTYPLIGIIAFSSLSSAVLVENLLSIGVKGFVNKKQVPGDIISCIEKVFNNQICVPQEYHFLTSKYHISDSKNLSPREIEILNLIAQELTSIEIAEKLDISTFTVENHRKSIFKKLEVKNLAGLIMVASRLGYLYIDS